MRKIAALLLACAILMSFACVQAEETGKYEKLTVGITTPFSGNFLDDVLGSNICDQDVRELIHGYNLVTWDPDKGSFEFNQPMVTGGLASGNSQVYVISLAENMTYNDGSRITAKDYAFSLLLLGSPQLKEAAGSRGSIARILGGTDYMSGKTKELAGIRLMGDYQFSITIDPTYDPYFYQLKILDISPLPINEIAPGCAVKSNDRGVYIEGQFTSALLEKTILDPETGYMSHPKVTCGPYKLTAYDGNSVTLDLNNRFLGDKDGEKPTIPQIVIQVTEPKFLIGDLATGAVDLAVRCARSDQLQAGISLVSGGDFRMKAYSRAGLSFISFCTEKGPTANLSVRQAAAMCMVKLALTDAYLGRYGTTVNGYYGIGQWMFRLATGAMSLSAGEGEEGEQAEESDLSDISIDRLTGYPLDPAGAAKLLEEDGWNLNADGGAYTDGVRYKALDGKLIPLKLKLIYPEGNGAGPMLKKYFGDHLEQAGIELVTEAIPMTELLEYYYRQKERDCDMILLGTNFNDVFDPSGEYDENWTSYLNNITDPELAELAVEMRSTQPGDAAEYCRRWLAYQERRAAVAAEIPLYSDAYMDFHISALQEYAPAPTGDWSMAIQSAVLSDPEAEEDLGGEDFGDGEILD